MKKVGDFTYLESSLGVLAQWDKNMTVYITVLAELKESTIGLCGMYDDNPESKSTPLELCCPLPKDDFTTSLC